MYTHSLFTFSSGATTAAALLGRITAATYQCQPRRKIDAPEWDPSRDEIVKSKVSSRFGAVGRERSVGRVAHLHADPPRAHNEERILEYAASWRVWKDSREGMEALTEEFNPFNPVNVAARAAAEARLAAGQPADDFAGLSVRAAPREVGARPDARPMASHTARFGPCQTGPTSTGAHSAHARMPSPPSDARPTSTVSSCTSSSWTSTSSSTAALPHAFLCRSPLRCAVCSPDVEERVEVAKHRSSLLTCLRRRVVIEGCQDREGADGLDFLDEA